MASKPTPELASPAERARCIAVQAVLREGERRAELGARHNRPPEYLHALIGDRHESLARRRDWDASLRCVERYRARHGVDDPVLPLGPPADDPRARAEQLELERELNRHLVRLNPHRARDLTGYER